MGSGSGMDHAYFKDRLSALFDNELPPQEKQIVEEHVRDCAECQAALAKLQQLEDAVKRHSELADTDYWEESAQKIERQLGFDQQTVITLVRHKWYERGLAWKALAAAASLAVLAYIGLNSDKILRQQDLEPSPTPAEEKRTETPQVSPLGIPHADSAAAQKAEPTKKPLATVRDEAARKGAGAVESQVKVEAPKAEADELAPLPAPKDVNVSVQMVRESTELGKQIVSDYATNAVPQKSRAAAPAALSAESIRTVPDEAVGRLEEESKEAAVAQIDSAVVDSMLVWWRKKRDALETVRSALPGDNAIGGLNKMAAPTNLKPAERLSPQQTRDEIERQLLEAWYNIARLTEDAEERGEAVTEIRKVADQRRSHNHAVAVDYLRQLGEE